MRTSKNRLRAKSMLSSYALRSPIRTTAPSHHKYDHSAAIWPQNTTPVRLTAKNLYDSNSADYTIRKKSVTRAQEVF
jgi:hypothetical protein